jgi:hypothetical protein
MVGSANLIHTSHQKLDPHHSGAKLQMNCFDMAIPQCNTEAIKDLMKAMQCITDRNLVFCLIQAAEPITNIDKSVSVCDGKGRGR